MDKRKEGYSLLLKELEKITISLNISYDLEIINKLSSSLKISDYNFLEEGIMTQVNELLKKMIIIAISNKDDSTLFNLMNIYSLNTQFYLDDIDNKRKSYSKLFLDNLSFYPRIVNLIIENNMVSNNLMGIVESIQNQVILSKLIVQFESSKLLTTMFENRNKKNISSLEREKLNTQNIINSEISASLILLFRHLIKNKRQNYARTMISILRRNLFIEARKEKRGGVVEKLLELHGEFLRTCVEEQDKLAFILFYSLKDVLDKIYDPKKGSLDDARTINREYLPLVSKQIYNSFILLITSSSDKEYIKTILKGTLDFYKNSRVFDDYSKEFPYFLEKLFYSICCFCLENNYLEVVKMIIEYSLPLPREYVLVGEKGLLPLESKKILNLFSSEDYSSMDKENIQLILFLILISKFYDISSKKELKKIFEEIDVDAEVLNLILMRRSNLETLIKRSDIYNNLFNEILGHDKFMTVEVFSKEFLKFIERSEAKIEETDKKKDLDKIKVKSFIEAMMSSFKTNNSIDEIVQIRSLEEIQEFSLAHKRIKHDKIWFVDVSGTIGYVSDPIGSDFGSDFSKYELKMLTQKLNEVGDLNEFKDKEEFVRKLGKLDKKDLVLLCPFSFESKIRELIKYDYSESLPKTFIEVEDKEIQIYLYHDSDELHKAFIFPRRYVEWERQNFDFDTIKGTKDSDLRFKNQPLKVEFVSYKSADEKDKKHISKTEIIIQVSYGYKLKIKDSKKILVFRY